MRGSTAALVDGCFKDAQDVREKDDLGVRVYCAADDVRHLNQFV